MPDLERLKMTTYIKSLGRMVSTMLITVVVFLAPFGLAMAAWVRFGCGSSIVE